MVMWRSFNPRCNPLGAVGALGSLRNLRIDDAIRDSNSTSLQALAKGASELKPLLGRHYRLPLPVAHALERVFEQPIGGVVVIEHSAYARAHRGMWATTRPNRILLAISGAQFIANPELLLHEYFHVLRQWGTG